MKTRPIHIVCFVALLAALALPLLQERTGMFRERPLAGVEPPADTVPFSRAAWFDGSFQANFAVRQYQWMGLRPSMVRLHNQLDYSIFGETYYSVMVGRDNEMFGRGSLYSMQGRDFVGTAAVDAEVAKTLQAQTLLAARGTQLLVVFTPSKLECMPQYLPGAQAAQGATSNHTAFAQALRRSGVHLLDLTSDLSRWVTMEPYRVFPRTGTHWTDYGAALGAQVILAELERLGGRPLVRPEVTAVTMSDSMRGTDADVGDLLNLIRDVPPATIAYPTLRMDTTGRHRPRTLVIGDSFWWKVYDQGIHRTAFASGSQYRYYNYEVFSDQWQGARLIMEFDMRETLRDQEFVILCINADNMHRYSFGVMDQINMALGSL